MSKGVLIIIDPQNDFTNRKGYYAQHHSILQIEKAKHQINVLLSKWEASNVVIIYSDYFFGQFKEGAGFCIPETFGHAFDTDLNFSLSNQYFIKNKHSAFSSSIFEKWMIPKKDKPLLICGFLAEYCVLQTAKDALLKQYKVTLVDDCIGTGDDVQWRKKIMFDNLIKEGAVISNSDLILASR